MVRMKTEKKERQGKWDDTRESRGNTVGAGMRAHCLPGPGRSLEEEAASFLRQCSLGL